MSKMNGLIYTCKNPGTFGEFNKTCQKYNIIQVNTNITDTHITTIIILTMLPSDLTKCLNVIGLYMYQYIIKSS